MRRCTSLMMSEPVDQDAAEEQRSRMVEVPIRRGEGPFDRPEYAEVPEDTAAQWSDRVWHDRPPR